MNYYDDTPERIEKAQKELEEMKDFERSTPMYVWKKGSVVISYNTLESLQHAVKVLGYQWNEGKLGVPLEIAARSTTQHIGTGCKKE
jgi:hypothetical protein